MRSALTLFFLIFYFQAEAAPLQAPRSMLSGNSGFTARTLGFGCFAFDLPADALPCNPAFLAKRRESRLSAHFFLGNNVNYLKEVSAITRNQADEATVRELFSKRDDSEFAADLEAGYSRETFGFAISPLRLGYSSIFRNPALPELTLTAVQEESIRAQFASYMGNDLYWGIQIRGVQRKFVIKHLFLTDLLAEDGFALLEPDRQSAIFIEPSLLYSLEEHPWRPEVSVSITNFGATWPTRPELPVHPQYHLSSSFTHEIGWGVWGIGFDSFWDRDAESFLEPLTLASFYEFGILRILGSLAQKSTSAGFQVDSRGFQLGLNYTLQKVSNGWGEESDLQRLYLMLGLAL